MIADIVSCAEWTAAFNAMSLRHPGRGDLLAKGLGGVGANVFVRPVFSCDYGYNIYLGSDVSLNFNVTILDVARVEIGSGTQIGPHVQIYTADHPRDPALRDQHLESGRPISIGRNVWIGGARSSFPV